MARRVLPYIGLLLLVIGILSPIVVINNAEYNIFELHINAEKNNCL